MPLNPWFDGGDETGATQREKVIGNDKEAWAYATSIKNLLTTAGFEVNPEMQMFISSGDGATGVRMSIKNVEHQPPHAGVIQKGFESIDINATGTPAGDSLDEDTVEIRIGAKT